MASRVIILENLTNEEQVWGSKVYQPYEAYSVPREDYPILATDYKLFEDVIDKVKVSSDSTVYTSKIDAWNYIIGDYPQEVIPRSPKNEHNLRPLGKGHKHINSANQIYDATITGIGLVEIETGVFAYGYEYVGNLTPAPYDCLSQDDMQKFAGVISYDSENDIVYVKGLELSDGSCIITRPINLDVELSEEYADIYSVWGMYASAKDYGEDDFVRLQVIDLKGEGVSLGYYTQEEFDYLYSLYGCVVLKEYDEIWVNQMDKINELLPPDKTCAEIPAKFYMRAKYYAKDITKTNIRWWLDYLVSFKDA
jgi:hypothetical protein